MTQLNELIIYIFYKDTLVTRNIPIDTLSGIGNAAYYEVFKDFGHLDRTWYIFIKHNTIVWNSIYKTDINHSKVTKSAHYIEDIHIPLEYRKLLELQLILDQ